MSEPVIVPGANLTAKLAWLKSNVQSDNSYIVDVNADESIEQQELSYEGKSNINITLKGINSERTIRLSTGGRLFNINEGITLVLENNITLHGIENNVLPLVYLSGGNLIMNSGSSIINNKNTIGDGIWFGGGVFVEEDGTFTMNGGTISGNAGGLAGGVNVLGTFTMNDGIISGNTANRNGGGVNLEKGIFTLNGGTISGNNANVGGGVSVRGTFTMNGGTISGNSVTGVGGGVYVGHSSDMSRIGIFTKKAGTITGYASDTVNGNVVRDESGKVKTGWGHAIAGYKDNIITKIKDITIEPTMEMSYEAKEGISVGSWDVKNYNPKKAEEQYDLGINYLHGNNGVSEDLDKAIFWLTKAAEHGHLVAMKWLSSYYYSHNYVNDGYYWLKKAGKHGDKSAYEATRYGPSATLSGCYIATCVYGSYDCPEVWTLRRYRDGKLSASWFGKRFIQIYYSISPKVVELFGNKKWFNSLCKPILNKFVGKLRQCGLDSSSYSDM